jgi:hypothetical protein
MRTQPSPKRPAPPASPQPGQPADTCAVGPASRNNYYTGKLLTARDLRAEQQYFLDRLRLHDLLLHGWGTVCGLHVEPHPVCPDKKFHVHPGAAIDGCGRVIRVAAYDSVDLPAPPPGTAAPVEPCPPEPAAQGAQAAKPADPGPQPCPSPLTLYVYLHYDEQLTEMTPAPFDECASVSTRQQANRVCEGYRLGVSTEKPHGWVWENWPSPDCAGTALRDEYVKRLHDLRTHCPHPGEPHRVPLAVVSGYSYGAKVEKKQIDNHHRPMLPSVALLDGTLRGVLDALSAPTHVKDMNWNHDGPYDYTTFRGQFISEDGKDGKGFAVTFSNPVRESCLTPYTFQAVVVRYPNGNNYGYFEAVPAKVWYASDGTTATARLGIDPDYADSCLQAAPFDLYLTLRCNLVLDLHGCPVDGELRARWENNGVTVRPPTGNGMPGGTLESWIHVNPAAAKVQS